MKKTFLLFIFLWAGIISVQSQISYKATNGLVHKTQWIDLDSNGSAINFSSYDDENSSPVDIGFNFNFNGQSYSKMIINTNGFIKLDSLALSSASLFYSGGQSTSGGVFNNTTSSDSCILAVFNTDLQAASSTTSVRVYISGSTGSRICTIQWKNFKDKHATPGTQFDSLSFQMKLYEGTNRIDYIYGPFYASSNTDDRVTVAVGIRGADNSNANLLTITKPSTTTWDQSVIQDGNYVNGGFGVVTHNVRKSILPDSGITYTLMPVFPRDIKPTAHTIGKAPIYFTSDQRIGAGIVNNGKDTMSYFNVILNVYGANTHTDTFLVDWVQNPGDKISFDFPNLFTPVNLGTDTFVITVDDDNSFNNYTYIQNITTQRYSYTDQGKSPSGSYSFSGFGATGEIVAKFVADKSGILNNVNLSFSTSNINYKVVVYDVDTTTWLPSTQLYISPTSLKTGSNVTASLGTGVAVGKVYFIGVRQSSGFGAGAIGLSYQNESPMRDSTFYYTTPSGTSNWNDFSSGGNNYRFYIEPGYILPKDLAMKRLFYPARDTCTGGRMMDVLFMVRNAGSDTVDFSKDTVNLITKVVYPDGSTATYGPTYISTGMLAPGDSSQFSATNLLDMRDTGWFQISGYIEWKEDMDHGNDTLAPDWRHSTGSHGKAISMSGTSLCEGDTAILNASQSKYINTYQWYNDNGFIQSATDTIYYATQPGNYYVEVTNIYGCTSYSDSVVLTFNPKPQGSLSTSVNSFCPGDSSLLTVSTNDTIYNFTWILNGTSLGQGDSLYYAKTAGDYEVTITNKYTGCYITTNTVTLNQYSYPDTTVIYTNTIACDGDSIRLAATSTNGYTYQWYNNQNAIAWYTDSIAYAPVSGVYQVEVTSPDGCKSMNAGVNIYIDSLPVAFVYTINGQTSFCDNDSIELASYSTSGYTYQWSDLSGAISGATNYNYMAYMGGDYSVEVTNTNGCKSVSSALTINSKPLPIPSLKNTAVSSFCSGDSLLLEVIYNAGNTYQWTLNGSDISGATDTMIYVSSSGDYAVRETWNGCSDVTSPLTINSLTRPTPTIQTSGSSPVCQGTTFYMTYNTSATILSAQWYQDGNAISGSVGDTLYINTSGDYNVYLTSTNGCSDSAGSSVAVTVNPLPGAGITVTGTTTFCSGDSVKLEATATQAISGVQWYLDGNMLNGVTSSLIYAKNQGNYTVYITATNGCSELSSSIMVTVNQTPVPVLSSLSATTICDGDSVKLEVTNAGSGNTIEWLKDGSIINGINNSIYYARTSGNYSTKLTSTAGCTGNSGVISVTVNPKPAATITYTKPVLTANSGAGYTYQWYLNGIKITGATNSTHTALQNGSYTVEITNSFGCTTLSAPTSVGGIGISAMDNGMLFNIYPNPVQDIVQIEFGGNEAGLNHTIYILDVTGKMVGNWLKSTESKLVLDINTLTAGVYFMTIYNEKGAVSRIQLVKN